MSRIQNLWNRIPEGLRFCLPVWMIMRVSTSLWAVLIWKVKPLPVDWDVTRYHGLQPILGGIRGAILGVWQRWDTIYYEIIAEKGYSGGKESVFFPLYPFFGRVLALFTGKGGELAGLWIASSLFFLLVMLLLYYLSKRNFSLPEARRAVIALAVFPTSFYYLALYPQSLLLALTLLATLLAQERHWLAAAFVALFTGLTHSTSLPLAMLLLIEVVSFLRTDHRPLRWAALGTAVLPVAGTALFFSWRIWQGFSPMTRIWNEGYRRILTTPWNNLWHWLTMIPNHVLSPDWIANGLALILMAAVLIWGIKKLPLSWELYLFTLLLFLLTTTVQYDPLLSYSRFILAAFPVFVALGMWADTRWKQVAGIILGLSGYLIFLSRFLMWQWVA